MKINIKQEGGFIGMASKAKLDFDKLTDEEQKMLTTIAEKAAAEAEKAAEDAKKAADQALEDAEKGAERDLDAPISATNTPSAYEMSPARDTFSYSLSMRKDGKKINVVFDDTNAPSGLVELFQKHIEP